MNPQPNQHPAHSPLPWSAHEGQIVSDSRYVATVDDWSNPNCAEQYRDINNALKAESEANAAYIVKACNSHQALVDALRAIIDDERGDWPRTLLPSDLREQAREALRSATQ